MSGHGGFVRTFSAGGRRAAAEHAVAVHHQHLLAALVEHLHCVRTRPTSGRDFIGRVSVTR
jgi:hypothetical protein